MAISKDAFWLGWLSASTLSLLPKYYERVGHDPRASVTRYDLLIGLSLHCT